MVYKPEQRKWYEPQAWREGFCDAIFHRPSKNPYTFRECWKMWQYNAGYFVGEEVRARLGIPPMAEWGK